MKYGCCTDKACIPSTCMRLPDGATCGDCALYEHCKALLQVRAESTVCDFFPRRFTPACTKPERKP